MANRKYEEYEEEYLEEEEEGQKKASALPVFLISAGVHAVVILLTLLVVFTVQSKVEDVVVTTEMLEAPEEEEEEVKERDVIKEKVDVQVEVEVEVEPVVTNEEVTDHMESENEMEAETAEGVSEAISDQPLVGSGVMGNIGGGGGGGGAFGMRTGGGKKRALMRGGGSKKTESSVDAALRWLKRHQEPDGSWNGQKYGRTDPRGEDPAHTGLATLAFLAAGHTPRIGKYRETVKKALDWILSKQKPNGSFELATSSHRIYDNAICALTLAEAYAMHPDPKIKEAAQKAIDYLSNVKSNEVHFNTNEDGIPLSMSVLGWVMMAFKSAKVAGLHIPPDKFDKIMKRITEMTDKDQSGNMERVHYLKHGDRNNSGYGNTMTAVGMLVYEYLGVKRFDLTAMADLLIQDLPQWGANTKNNHDFYHWYYGTLALFQYGGDHWKKWNEALIRTLVDNQRKGGPLDGSLDDVDGSWDPVTNWGKVEGRVYTTAMGAFCLEVYYRYQSVFK